MMRIVNGMSDRLLGLFVPRVTAAAADCGYPKDRKFCDHQRHVEYWCRCWTNSNCACGSCWYTTTAC
jgi:hypothetical protein